MAITNIVDFTEQYNANGGVVIFDASGWDSLVVQVVGGTDISAFTTNDGGEVTGSIPSNIITAANFQTISGYDLSTGTLVASINAPLVAFTNFGKYFQIGSAAGPLEGGRVIVKFQKIG